VCEIVQMLQYALLARILALCLLLAACLVQFAGCH
jgi:hypothetical protein